MAKSQLPTKLPKRIYAKWEADQSADSSYLIADETIKSMDHGDRVGVYELVETKTMNISQALK